jgi:pimeloyl-ACP methyl ester carboxylesterase
MDYSVHCYRSADGTLDLAARIYSGTGPDLLLMHGLTRNSADFEPLAQHLAGRFRLIVPDQRGRGLSQWDPDTANYRPDVYAQDMLGLLDGLGIGKCGVIGTSMGGLIAMVMNALRPEAITALVLNDVGPVLDPAGLARIQSYVGPAGPMASWDEAAARCRAINSEALPRLKDSDWRAFARRTCREQEAGTVIFDYDPAIAQGVAIDDPKTAPPDMWPLWEALDRVPVLVVRGALSDLLSRETVAAMRSRHSGPFEAVEVPETGHAPILDEPVALQAIQRFLAAHVC